MRVTFRRRLQAVLLATALAIGSAVVGGTTAASAEGWCDGPGGLVLVSDHPRAKRVDHRGNRNGTVCRYEWWVSGSTKIHYGFYDDTVS